jgi:hypothetical protein
MVVGGHIHGRKGNTSRKEPSITPLKREIQGSYSLTFVEGQIRFK